MLGAIQFGFISIYPSPTGFYIRQDHGLTDTSIQWSLYNSITFLFAAIAPFITKFILNKFNGKRRNTIFVIDIMGTVFWFLNCLTKINIYAGICTRALLGIVIGCYSSIISMYLVEIAPEGLSGFYGSLNQIGVVIGQCLWSFIGPFLSYMEYNYFGGAVCAVQAVLIWFIPESPDAGNANEENEGIPILKVFQAKYANGLIVGVVLMFIQQFCGINGILTNLSDIMSQAGLDIDPNYQSGISIVSQFISVFTGSLLIDKLGRRIVWIISSSICGVGLLLMALNEKFHWAAIFPLICIFIYNLGFGLGLGPIPWFIVSQLFEADARPAAYSVCVVTNWVFSFIIVMVFPEMRKSMGMFGALLLFFFVCIFSIIFGIFKVTDNNTNVDEDEASPGSEKSSDSHPSAL